MFILKRQESEIRLSNKTEPPPINDATKWNDFLFLKSGRETKKCREWNGNKMNEVEEKREGRGENTGVKGNG